MSDNKYYSYQLPSREQFEENKRNNELHKASDIKSNNARLEENSFVEIEISSDENNYTNTNNTSVSTKNIAIPQRQEVNTSDEKRALFYKMRLIGRDNMFFNSDKSKEFYYQALFVKDIEDDYDKSVPFSSYFPYYQQMSYEQLRTYFTWRTKVRKGIIENTSLSYAFVYIYELLNNIGVADCEDGLKRLVEFWQAFREYDDVIDRYVVAWIKDYHVYYPLEKSFKEFVAEHNLYEYYPAVFGHNSDKQISFDLFAGISKYKIRNSIFYTEETKNMIGDCFYYILTHLRKAFEDKNECFDALIFYPLNKGSMWTPFNNALFFPMLKQQERQVAISDNELYIYINEYWMYKTVMLSDQGKQLISYIMKEMEASLRQAVKFKHKLVANSDMYDASLRRRLKTMKIVFPEYIQELVKEFYTIFTRKKVSVNIENLKQIRNEALQIQEKLIVPEEIEVNERVVQKEPIVEEKPVQNNPWLCLKNALTPVELGAIELILKDMDIKAYAVQNMVMIEILIDEINQKSMDFVGDTIMELSDTVVIFDEYRENLIEMVKNNG